MASKKYIVRQGFVVPLEAEKPDGGKTVKTFEGGDELTLDDEQAALHLHKLEFASQKDRDAAVAAEQQAKVEKHVTSSPVEFMAALVNVVAQAQAAAAVQAPASTTA